MAAVFIHTIIEMLFESHQRFQTSVVGDVIDSSDDFLLQILQILRFRSVHMSLEVASQPKFTRRLDQGIELVTVSYLHVQTIGLQSVLSSKGCS